MTNHSELPPIDTLASTCLQLLLCCPPIGREEGWREVKHKLVQLSSENYTAKYKPKMKKRTLSLPVEQHQDHARGPSLLGSLTTGEDS